MISKTIGFRGLAYFQTHPFTRYIQIPVSTWMDRSPDSDGTLAWTVSESHSFHATLAPICPRGGKDHGHRIGQVLRHVASLDHRDLTMGISMGKNMGIHGNFMELHRIQWDLMGVHRIFIGFHGIIMEI